MADEKLSQLANGAASDSTLMYIVNALTSFKCTLATLYAYIKSKLDSDTIDGGSFS